MNGKLIRQAAVVTALGFSGAVLLIQAALGGKSIAESLKNVASK